MVKDLASVDEPVRVHVTILIPSIDPKVAVGLRSAVLGVVADFPKARVDMTVSDAVPDFLPGRHR